MSMSKTSSANFVEIEKERSNIPASPSTSTRAYNDFNHWVKTVNEGQKTTLHQQFTLAVDLYQQAFGKDELWHTLPTVNEIIRLVENTPVESADSLVSWTGIHVGWFLYEFCESPYVTRLQEFGCQTWFVRKVCVIVMVLATAATTCTTTNNKDCHQKGQRIVTGTLVNHIDAVVRKWCLKKSIRKGTSPCASDAVFSIIESPTTFVSYTGTYTIRHVVKVLERLDPNEYIWMDIFCVNQFAWTGKGRSEEMIHFRNNFMEDLQGRIHSIHCTALILEQWDKVMDVLGQMWVLWEIFNTAQAEAQFQVLLTAEQTSHFIRNCLESGKEFELIRSSLATINADNARTEDDLDRQAIFGRMKAVGLNRVNEMVLGIMRAWLAGGGLKHAEKSRLNLLEPSSSLLSNLALLLQDQGKLSEAEPLCEEALDACRRQFGNEDPNTLVTINVMAGLRSDQGKLQEAEALYRESLEGRMNVFGADDLETLVAVNNYGLFLQEAGRFQEAEPYTRLAAKGRREKIGDEHPKTLTSINNLACLLRLRGNFDEAEPLCREVMEGRRKVLGKLHPRTLTAVKNMAGVLSEKSKWKEAEVYSREALEGLKQQLGNEHPTTLGVMMDLGALLTKRRIFQEAEVLLQHALEGLRQQLGQHHHDTLMSMDELANLYQVLSKRGEAEALLREVLASKREQFGVKNAFTLKAVNNLGLCLYEQGKLEETEVLLLEALNETEELLGPESIATLVCVMNLANLRRSQGKMEASEGLYRRALAGRRKRLGDHHIQTVQTAANLAGLLDAVGKDEEAEEMYMEGLRGRRQRLGDRHPDTIATANALISLWNRQGKTDKADALIREFTKNVPHVSQKTRAIQTNATKMLNQLALRD